MTSSHNLDVTRRQVVEGLNVGADWETVGTRLGIRPGLAFMIATGIPADGSGVPDLPPMPGSAAAPASPQRLVNDHVHNPLRNERVDAWVRERAARELTS